jgi:hypothetical protein
MRTGSGLVALAGLLVTRGLVGDGVEGVSTLDEGAAVSVGRETCFTGAETGAEARTGYGRDLAAAAAWAIDGPGAVSTFTCARVGSGTLASRSRLRRAASRLGGSAGAVESGDSTAASFPLPYIEGGVADIEA